MRQITIDLGAYIEEKKRRERRGGTVMAAAAILAALVLVALPRTPTSPGTPHLAATPAALTFPTQTVGTASAAQIVPLRNDGEGALSISSLASSDAAFRVTHDCTVALAKGDTCSATIVFAPPAPGPRRGELQIATNAGTREIALIGDAPSSTSPTLAAVDLGRLDFGSAVIKTPRPPQRLRFVNSGATAVTFGAPIISSPFVVATDGCRDVPPGGTCDVDVALPSDIAGSFTGQLRLVDTRGSLVAFSALGGTTTNAAGPLPTPAQLAATPARLAFLAQPVGTTSAAQLIRLRNDGDAPLSIGKIATGGDVFRVSHDCGRPLARNDSCSATVVFAPVTPGRHTGAVAIETNGGAASIALDGEAKPTPAHLVTSPASLVFPPQLISTASAAQSVRLQNDGGEPLSIGNIEVKGAFRVSNDCGKTLASNSACSAAVVFVPLVAGKNGGVLAIDTNGGSATIPLGGEGRPLPVIELPPTDFGRAFAGTAVERAVPFTNSGPATILIGKATAPPPFEVSSDGCRNGKVAPGDGCEVRLQFRPAARGVLKSELVLVDPRGQVVAKGTLRGIGMVKEQPPQLPNIDIKPREINFLGDPGKKTIVVTNIGAIPVSLSVKPETQTRYLVDASQCNAAVLSPAKQCSIVVDGTFAVRLGTSTRIAISYDGRTEFVPVRAK